MFFSKVSQRPSEKHEGINENFLEIRLAIHPYTNILSHCLSQSFLGYSP